MDERYGDLIAGNLWEKYYSFRSKNTRNGVRISEPDGEGRKIYDSLGKFVFQSNGKARSKLITIKQGTPEETKVKGYLYEFTVEGPPELIRMGYYAGFGEKNSLGFGCVEIISEGYNKLNTNETGH